MNNKLLLILFTVGLFGTLAYGQTSDLDKLKEYNQMLKDSLITQQEYDKLKQQLLFQQPDTTQAAQQAPQQVVTIMSTRKQISNADYLRLQGEYKRKISKGTTLIVMGAVFDVLSASFYLVGKYGGVENPKALFAVSGVTATISLPMLITGIVKLSRNKNNMRRLDTDYQIIARL